MGDFNFSDIEWDNSTAVHNNTSSLKFLNTLQDNFLLQYINIPTRGRGSDVPRILDLVISNTEIVTSIEYLAPLGKSDHSLLVVYTNLQEQKELTVPRPNYSKGQYDELRQFLDLDWDVLLSLHKNYVENMWNIIKEKIVEGVNKYVPSSLPFSSWKKLHGNNLSVPAFIISLGKKVNFGNDTFKVKTLRYCLLTKKIVISSEIKLDRQTDLIKMK